MENKPNYQIEKVQAGRELTPAVWGMIKNDIAPVLAKAHIMTVDKMAATLLKGYELGLSFTASLELVQVVQGKTSLSPRGALALVQNSPLIKSVTLSRLTDAKGTFTGYECTIERANGFAFTARWTMEQAKVAGLIKAGSGWEHYPENMCMWRAIGFACDTAASDITCGLTALLKMPEQMGKAIDDGGNIIDAQFTPVTQPTESELVAEWLNFASERFEVTDILAANAGNMPVTMDECREIERMLGGEA